VPRAVADARDQEYSWAAIGDLLGVTRASALQRYVGGLDKNRTPIEISMPFAPRMVLKRLMCLFNGSKAVLVRILHAFDHACIASGRPSDSSDGVWRRQADCMPLAWGRHDWGVGSASN
jgi:hypothetical protein